jgi:murein DD-endopeptidase MepM/ murein hydrolase activator NlpD
MELAKTGRNPKSATFGNTRINPDGTPKPHDGIDIAASIGTPVHSITSGTILWIVSKQPNRIGKNKYPAGYDGDDNDAGNRVYVLSSDGIQVGYWHLMSGTTLKEKDTVKVGDIIGYVGITGNASVDVPHLHLQASKNGEKIDPASLLSVDGISTEKYEKIKTLCD